MLKLSKLAAQPAGFGQCQECQYREGGSAAICFACASATIQQVSDHSCTVCDQTLPAEGAECRNYWCRQPQAVRGFRRVYAIAMRTGELERAINRYKFSNRRGWAAIFGRVVAGFLDEYSEDFEDYDLIVGSPTYTGDGARRSWDHIGAILDAAIVESGDWWPFDDAEPRAIVKTRETPRMSRLGMWDRRQVAETELRVALSVPDPGRVNGGTILVVDDIFTDGTTLRETALKLREAGAERVDGLVLARQPWTY